MPTTSTLSISREPCVKILRKEQERGGESARRSLGPPAHLSADRAPVTGRLQLQGCLRRPGRPKAGCMRFSVM